MGARDVHPSIALTACRTQVANALTDSLAKGAECAAVTGGAVTDIGPASDSAVQGRSSMADHVIPHFHNEPGVSLIEIGAREFMCIGARPPFDHPHIFLDMGDDREIICSYCSTLFRYNAALRADEALPPECALREPAGVRDPASPRERLPG